jgi:O-antigen/teichoic acid export membrane protein
MTHDTSPATTKNSSLSKNTLLISAGTMVQKTLSFVMLPFFASWVSVDDYGVYDLYLTYVSLCIPFLTLGISDAVFRYSIESDGIEHKRPFVTNGLAINIFGIVLFLIIMAWGRTLINPKLLPSFLTLTMSEIANTHMQGVLRGIKRLDILGFASCVSSIVMVCLTSLFILKFSMGADGLLLGYASGYILSTLFSAFVIRYPLFLSLKTIDLKVIQMMLAFSLPLILNNVSWWVVNVSDRTIISVFLSTTENGVYAIANKIPAICIAIYGMFHIAWNQAASEMIDSNQKYIYFNDVFNKIFRILISLISGLLALNFFVFKWLFDNRYEAAAFHAPILLLAVMFHALGHFMGGIQIALKNSKANGLTTFIGAISNVVIHLMLVKFIGLFAASISTILSEMIIFSARYMLLREHLSLKLNKSAWRYVAYCMYMFVSTSITNIVINIVNLMFASIMFVLINKEMVLNMRSKAVRFVAK